MDRRSFLKTSFAGVAMACGALPPWLARAIESHETAWQAIVRDNDGKRCAFVSTLLARRKG